MKYKSLILLLISIKLYSQNQIGEEDKKTLKLLLQERKERFEQYTKDLDNKSGFFGNQTKKDLKNINEVLKEIVRTDNKIILELDAVLDQKRYETKSYEFENKRSGEDLARLEQQNKKYFAAIDTLNKQVAYYKEGGRSTSATPYKWLAITFFCSTAGLLWLFYKKKKNFK